MGPKHDVLSNFYQLSWFVRLMVVIDGFHAMVAFTSANDSY